MSDIDEWRAHAKALGIKVDRRWSLDTIVAKVNEVTAEGEGIVDADDEIVAEPDPEPRKATVKPPIDDGWPRRVAPQVWLDQAGRRYTDLGQAMAGAEECRRR